MDPNLLPIDTMWSYVHVDSSLDGDVCHHVMVGLTLLIPLTGDGRGRVLHAILTDCLNTHRENVFGIAHTIETQYAHVKLLSQNISDIVSANNEDDFTENSGETPARICFHCTTEWQRNTRTLLASIQTSLRCQSKSLQSSFKRANKVINKILDYYRIDIGSSAEKEAKFWIDYEDSPEIDYEQKYKDLRKNSDIEVERLQQTIKTFKENIHESDKLAKRQDERLNEKDEKLKQLNKDNETLRRENNTLAENQRESEKRLQSMESLITLLNTDKENLMLQLKVRKRTISIQLYFNVKGDIIPKLLEELKTMLVTQMQVDRHELQFVLCQNESDVNQEIPLFVLCINASRLGTDASSALHNLKVSSKVSVIIFHHKDIHALPNQASERVLTGPEFRSLGGIFDIAFLAEKGIYPCEMNHATAVGIEEFLKIQLSTTFKR